MKKRGLIFSVIFHTAAIGLLFIIHLEHDEPPKDDSVTLQITYKPKTPSQNVIKEQVAEHSYKQIEKTIKDEAPSITTNLLQSDSLSHLSNLKIFNTFEKPTSLSEYHFDKLWTKKLTDEELWWEVVKQNPSFVMLNDELQKKYNDQKNKWKFKTEWKRKEPQMNFRLQFAPYSDGFQNGKINERMNSGGISLPISETIKSIIDLF